MKNGPYELVVAPDNYPGKRYRNRYCYEHHLVWWQNGNRLPTNGEVVHHVNGKKRDNRLENLELKTVGEHNKEHSSGRTTKDFICKCGKRFTREVRQLHTKTRKRYCSKQCSGKFARYILL